MQDPVGVYRAQSPYETALRDFQRARARAALDELLGRFQGRSTELLSYDEVVDKLRVTGRAEAGKRAIPVTAIVGSVGRYHDFTRAFLPRQASDAQRWARVKAAVAELGEMPPIEVYRIGDAYFVRDGNHRVSIARQQGVDQIDAVVTEVRTRVPLASDDNPDTLIVKAEYADFLARTRLDRLRPDASLEVSVPGQYDHLENHIEVQRYFFEEEAGHALGDEEAIVHWYDNAFLPLVEAIREQGILRYFPGRTEADLYVWLARHQATLRNELGWDLPAETAVSKLSLQVEPAPTSLGARLRAAVRPLLPRRWRRDPRREQRATARVMARYSQQLFADILVPLGTTEEDDPVLTQALTVAAREAARLYGLYVPSSPGADAPADVEAAFARRCAEAGHQAFFAVEEGDPVATICRRATLTDLVVSARRHGVAELLARCPRPILFAPDKPASLRRLLLVYDEKGKGHEALFAAAYLAEGWQLPLFVIVPGGREKLEEAARTHLDAYLAMHELVPVFVAAASTPTAIAEAAVEHACDLVLLGGPGRRGSDARLQWIVQVVQQAPGAVLVCT